MSGVAAIYALDGSPIDAERIRSMLRRLSHRGPDGQGIHREGPVGLGHCLLATTPEDVGAVLPLQSTTSRAWIVADARIDNREELAGELGGALPWTGAPDAMMILAAYERWGAEVPAHLIGDFAFVIWDPARARMLCARDHFGVRSLFYQSDARTFRCASDMDALFAETEVPRRAHLGSMGLFLTEDYIERDQTLYEGVFAIPPATAILVTRGGVEHRAYWRPDPWRQIRYRAPGDYEAHFHQVLKDSVRCRLRSQAPVAAQLSGGLDSSSVVGEAETLRREGRAPAAPLELLHVAFPGLTCDEDDYSRAVAEHWHLHMTTVLPPATAAYGPETSRPPDVFFHPLHGLWERLFETTRTRGIRVTLTGMGADQVMRRSGVECADALRSGSLRDAAKVIGLDARPLGRSAWRRLLHEGLRPLLPERVKGALRRLRGRNPAATPRWLSARTAGAVLAQRAEARRHCASGSFPGTATRELCDSLTHGYEVIFALASLGPHAARWGAELRHPFYDLRLVETLLAFPHEQRCGVDVPKPLLRRSTNGVLPELVRVRRHPTEFTPYIRRVLLEDHEKFVRALFARSRLEEAGLVWGGAVRQLLEDARSDWFLMREVANLVGLELWLRQIT